MSTQYRLVQSGKTASGGCSAGQSCSATDLFYFYLFISALETDVSRMQSQTL
jgi:hypothetical protein